MYMISLCSRLISIYLILLLILMHIVSLYFACCHCKRHHVIILWHSIILLYIMLSYYDILWYWCFIMFLFFIVSFPQATCPVCCDVIFILHHPVFIFRSVIFVCFRRVNRKVRLNAEINTMSGLCDCIINYSIKWVPNDFRKRLIPLSTSSAIYCRWYCCSSCNNLKHTTVRWYIFIVRLSVCLCVTGF